METQQLVVVVVVTKLKKILFSLILLYSSIGQVFGEMMEKGKTKAKFLFNLFHQNSDDGEQVYDGSKREEANVIEPMIFVEHQITKDTAVNAHFVFDFWTAASDTKLDAQTGASGGEPIKGQSRVSGSLGVRREVDKWSLSGGVGFSSEYDYRSFNANIGVEHSFAKDNFTLGLGVQYYNDEVRLFPDLTPKSAAIISEFLPRKILATNLTASQILTRRDIIQFGLTFAQAKDNLESTASSVLVNNIREVEQLPNSRKRYALSSKWVHGFNDRTAMNLSYRYYTDKWDLDANTIRLALLRELNEDDYIEFAMRAHRQTEAKYYASSFSEAKEFMTSDSDLNKFSSYELSLLYSNYLDDGILFGIDLEDIIWNNGITAYRRSNGLFNGFYQSSIGFKF